MSSPLSLNVMKWGDDLMFNNGKTVSYNGSGDISFMENIYVSEKHQLPNYATKEEHTWRRDITSQSALDSQEASPDRLV